MKYFQMTPASFFQDFKKYSKGWNFSNMRPGDIIYCDNGRPRAYLEKQFGQNNTITQVWRPV